MKENFYKTFMLKFLEYMFAFSVINFMKFKCIWMISNEYLELICRCAVNVNYTSKSKDLVCNICHQNIYVIYILK